LVSCSKEKHSPRRRNLTGFFRPFGTAIDGNSYLKVDLIWLSYFFNKPSHYEGVIVLPTSKRASYMTSQQTPDLYPIAVKESIRDLAQLQRTYDPSDEVFWTFFNARVLLNQPIEVDAFVRDAYGSGTLYGQAAAVGVE
jgi:hypothetical protein